MIIATIGHQEYELASMADAEALLNIIHRATPVSETYMTGAPNHYHKDHGRRSCSVEITNKQLVSDDEHDALMAEVAKKAALKEVA